jgi:hypothetical protein
MNVRHLLLQWALPLFVAFASVPSHAQNNPLITLDETGVGTILFPSSAATPLASAMLPDPGPGGLAAALTYNLGGPPTLLAGDLVLTEGGVISDVIRFNPANPATGYPASVVFYSDLGSEPNPPLADTGFPTAFYPLVLTLPEVGPEAGPNGITYTPTPNDPGYVNGFSVTYLIISDPVPEPGTLTLGAVGAAFGLALAWRRREARAR